MHILKLSSSNSVILTYPDHVTQASSRCLGTVGCAFGEPLGASRNAGHQGTPGQAGAPGGFVKHHYFGRVPWSLPHSPRFIPG